MTGIVKVQKPNLPDITFQSRKLGSVFVHEDVLKEKNLIDRVDSFDLQDHVKWMLNSRFAKENQLKWQLIAWYKPSRKSELF